MMRFFLMAVGLLGTLCAQAETDLWITKAETYLNRNANWYAEFTQVKSNELPKKGKIWVARPGRLRLDYEASSEHLYINNGWVTYVNSRFNEVTNIPIDATPAGFFLRPTISLTAGVRVTDVSHGENEVVFRVVDANDQSKGMVLLVFQKKPFTLSGWIIVDAVNDVTRIKITSGIKTHTKKHTWFLEKSSVSQVKIRD